MPREKQASAAATCRSMAGTIRRSSLRLSCCRWQCSLSAGAWRCGRSRASRFISPSIARHPADARQESATIAHAGCRAPPSPPFSSMSATARTDSSPRRLLGGALHGSTATALARGRAVRPAGLQAAIRRADPDRAAGRRDDGARSVAAGATVRSAGRGQLRLSAAASGTPSPHSTEISRRRSCSNRAAPACEKMQAIFAAVRMWGGGISLAYAVQAAASLMLAASVAWLWRSDAACRNLKAAALSLGSLLGRRMCSTTICRRARGRHRIFRAASGCDSGFRDFEISLLAAAWIVPLLSRGSRRARPASLSASSRSRCCTFRLAARDAGTRQHAAIGAHRIAQA